MWSGRRRERVQKSKFPEVRRLSSYGSRKRKPHVTLDRSPGDSRASHEDHGLDRLVIFIMWLQRNNQVPGPEPV